MPRSIFELLTIIAALSLGCASLRAGGMLAFVFVIALVVFVVGLTIIACVARDARQAFAIGFVIPIGLYALTHGFIGNQLDPNSSSALATTRMFGPLCNAFCEQFWVDQADGKLLPEFTPDLTRLNRPVGPGFVYVSEAGVRGVLTEAPSRSTIILVAHYILASLLGYLGGRFALLVRRTDVGKQTEARRTIACTEGREPSGAAIENPSRVLGDA